MKKLIAKEFTVEKELTVTFKQGTKYIYLQDPETGKYYEPNDGWQVTATEGSDLLDMFHEIEASHGFEVELTGETMQAEQEFCDDCIHLKFNEGEQNEMLLETGRQVQHWCRTYQMRLTHGTFHPHLPRPGFCRHYSNEVPLKSCLKG